MVDPDSEIIISTVVTPGNAGDASVAEELIDDLLVDDDTADDDSADDDATTEGTLAPGRPKVYGDNAYGTGEFQERLEDADIDSRCKTQQPTAPGGLFAKDRFHINLDDDTVTCPNDVTVTVRRHRDSSGMAYFSGACATCPLREQCTTASGGRTIAVGPHEAALARARARQREPDWREDYQQTRPKVERKLAHLMRRKHGGRRARVRGTAKVDADFRLLAAAANLTRLATLGLRSTPTGGWATA